MKRLEINIENNTELMKQFIELMREEQRRIEQDKSTLGADRHEQQENHIEIK